MAKKSNKTAHVLNLISSAKSASEPKESSASIPDENKVTPVEPSSIQNSLSQSTKNEELSEKIRDNLLAEFEHGMSANTENQVSESDTTQIEMDTTDDANGIDRSEHTHTESVESSETSEEKNLVTDTQQIEAESNHIPSSADENIQNMERNEKTTVIESNTTSNAKEKTEALETPETGNTDNSTASDFANTISNDVVSPTISDATNSDAIASPKQGSIPSSQSVISEDASTTPPHFIFVNICEELVKEKTVEYLKRFDVCTCSRCVADAMALALTNIQPKYVVMDPDTAVPFLSYYANKLSVSIMTELTKACLTVLAHPRHDPEIAKLELEQQAKQEAYQKDHPMENTKNE